MDPQDSAPQPQSQPQPQPNGGNYDFIMNPAKPPRKPLLPTNSIASRLLVVVGGIFVLLIIFVVVSNLLKGSNHVLPALTSVGQQQQELLQLTGADLQTGSSNQAPTLSANGKNFAATVQLTVGSAQSQLTTYLLNNHYKLKKNLFSLTLSKTLDEQLSAAVSAGNFESTFDTVMQSQLKTYERVLQQAYGQVTGPKGRALLSSDYDQAQLLLTQLSSPAS